MLVALLIVAALAYWDVDRGRFEDAIQSSGQGHLPMPTTVLAPLYPSPHSPRGGHVNIRLNLTIPVDGRNVSWVVLNSSDSAYDDTPVLLAETERLLRQWNFRPGRREALFRVTLSFRSVEAESTTRRIRLVFAEPIVQGAGLKQEKRLLVRGRIRADGLVDNVRFEGDGGLEPFVRAAVALWRYAPSSSETAFSAVVSIHNAANGILR